MPYILFAPIAGWLADRYRKSTVILGCKIAEIAIMAIGVLAVSLMGKPNPSVGLDPFFWLLLVSVFLMGAQSALFAPAKVGTLPELLTEKNIAAGNGIFNVADVDRHRDRHGYWRLAVRCNLSWANGHVADDRSLIGIAVVGTALSLLIRTLPAANPRVRFPVNVPAVLFSDIAQLFSYRSLFRVALGIVFFWSVAAFSTLNIDVFSMESGGLLESDRTPLLMAVTIGIGLGSVLAGVISQGRIELGLVPLGAMGMALFSFLLAFAPRTLSPIQFGRQTTSLLA